MRDILGLSDLENTSVIFRIGEIISRTLGNKSQSLKEKYLKQTENILPKDAFAYLDPFLDEELLKEGRLTLSITKSQNKIDKRKWKYLEENFMDYLKVRNKTQ